MKLKNLFLLLLLASLWGPSFLFIKVAVAEIPPITLVLGRVSIGALLLLAVLRLQNGRLPAPTVWKHVAFVALFHNAIPFVLFGWGEQYISSALASILNGTTPLFTIILAHFFVTDDRLTPTKILGVLVGFAGLMLLIWPSLAGGVQVTTLGILAIVAASACYGVAIIYTRNHLRNLPPLVAPTSQMIMATLYLLPASLLVDKPYLLPVPSWQALVSLFALGVLGTALAFIVYYRLQAVAEPTYVSMVTYVIPVVGVILGVAVLGEQLTWHTVAGFALILAGVMTVNGVFQQLTWRRLNQAAIRP